MFAGHTSVRMSVPQSNSYPNGRSFSGADIDVGDPAIRLLQRRSQITDGFCQAVYGHVRFEAERERNKNGLRSEMQRRNLDDTHDALVGVQETSDALHHRR